MGAVYTARAAVEVSGFTAHTDGSGAPAVVRVADFAFACDFIGGEVRLSCIRGPNAGRRAREVAVDRARRAYAAHVATHTTDDWRAANVAMYADLA